MVKKSLAPFAIIILIFFFVFLSKETTQKVLNIKPYIVDEYGNIITQIETQSIISPSIGSGYDIINNTNRFLALGSTLDNINGDTEITINLVTGNNTCAAGNNHPSCSTLQNKYGPVIDLKYTSDLPLTLAKGEFDPERISNGMNISLLEVGNVNFTLKIDGTYKSGTGSDISFTNYGSIVLEIQPEKCSDGTSNTAYSDANSSDSDFGLACSNSTSFRGKYCRVNITGSAALTDNAAYCGCCRPEGGGASCGHPVLGSVCT